MRPNPFVKLVSLSASLVGLIVSSQPLGAQQLPTSGDSILGQTAVAPKANQLIGRIGASATGAGAGALLGMLVGHVISTEDHRASDGPPGWDATYAGELFGVFIGAGVGTAMNELGGACNFEKRLGRSLLGAGIGSTAAYLLTRGEENRVKLVFAVPVGGVVGSFAAIRGCAK